MPDSNWLSGLVFMIAAGAAIFARLPVAFALMSALSFAPLFRFSVDFGAVPLGVRPEDFVLAVLVVRCVIKERLRPLAYPLRQFVFCYVGMLALLIVYTGIALLRYPLEEISFYLHGKVAGATAMLFVALRTISSEKDFQVFLRGVLAGGVVLSTCVLASQPSTAVVQYSVLYDAEMYRHKMSQTEYFSAWNPNSIGISAGALALIFGSLLFRRRSARATIVTLVATALFSFMLARSYTRTAAVAFLLTLPYMIWRSARHQRFRSAAGATAVVLVLTLLAAAGIRKEAYTMQFSDNVNAGDRVRVWSLAASSILGSPLGEGVGVEDLALASSLGYRASAHNDWFDFALMTGLGGACWALLTFFTMGRALRLSADAGSCYAVAGEILFVFFVVCSLGAQIFTFSKQPFVLLAGFLALANHNLSRRRQPKPVTRAVAA